MAEQSETLRDYIGHLVGMTGDTGLDLDAGLDRAARAITALVDAGEPVTPTAMLTVAEREAIRRAAETLFATALIVTLCARNREGTMRALEPMFSLCGRLSGLADLGTDAMPGAGRTAVLPIERHAVLRQFVEEYVK